MPNINRVFLAGHLTRDPELKYTQSGLAVCAFGLAVNRKFTTKDGGDTEEVLFVDVTAFGRQGETTSEYLSKGDPAFIEGRLKLDQWTDKEGRQRSKVHVVAQNVQFLGAKGNGNGGKREAGGEREAGSDESDIPF